MFAFPLISRVIYVLTAFHNRAVHSYGLCKAYVRFEKMLRVLVSLTSIFCVYFSYLKDRHLSALRLRVRRVQEGTGAVSMQDRPSALILRAARPSAVACRRPGSILDTRRVRGAVSRHTRF